MPTLDPRTLAQELSSAYAHPQIISRLSERDPSFDLDAAYAIEAELIQMRRAAGRKTVGRKVGYANRAVWRALKIDTLVWAPMYDDTVRIAESNEASFSVAHLLAPRIEPEIVLKLKEAPPATATDPAAVLQSVEWLALGFELVDCLFADGKYQPADFVAALGHHVGLVIGKPLRIERKMIPGLVEQLAQFKLRLLKNGELVAEGAGKNILQSPALCLIELGAAASRQLHSEPLAAGEIITTGTITPAQSMAADQTWTAAVDGLPLPDLTLRTTS